MMGNTLTGTGIAGSLLLVSMLLAGCAADAGSSSITPAAQDHPQYFVANEWQDQDRSGGADYWEFAGANKWTFRSDEKITFASRIKAPVGSTVTWVLHAPDGEVFEQGESQQNWESTWRRAYAGTVIDLLDRGGPGVWWCEWLVNELRVGECAANLQP